MKQMQSKSKIVIDVEERFGADINVILHDLYVIKDLDKRDISAILNVSRPTISKWLDMCGIYSKKLHIK